METKFQTSFIPKKPLISDPAKPEVTHRGSISIMMVISVILFVISIGGAIFSFVWSGVLLNAQDNYKKQLAESEKRFNITLIEDLKKFSKKIDIGKQLFGKHMSVSDVFPIIGQLTIESVKFDTFDFSIPNENSDSINVILRGVARDYNSIAFQSDVLGSPDRFGKNKFVKNPVVADIVEDGNGEVHFTFSGSINMSDLLYQKTFNTVIKDNDK